jgi:hypothetical protein
VTQAKTQPKEYPILFSAPMVRAILDNRKTQTRRVMKPQPIEVTGSGKRVYKDADFKKSWEDVSGTGYGSGYSDCPYGQPGDRLWVREAYTSNYFDGGAHGYRADWTPAAAELLIEPRWKPSIHMPRAACRILLEITDVRVERLREISVRDAEREGYPKDYGDDPGAIPWFRSLWQSINGPDSWEANPWVWVIEFKRITQ